VDSVVSGTYITLRRCKVEEKCNGVDRDTYDELRQRCDEMTALYCELQEKCRQRGEEIQRLNDHASALATVLKYYL